MTTIRQLITDGFREAGILAVNIVPDGEQAAEGLRQMRRILRSLFGNELGEPLRSINFGSAGLLNPYAKGQDQASDILGRYFPSGYRLQVNNVGAVTIYLDPNPMPGSRIGVIDKLGNFFTDPITLNANGKTIETAPTAVLQEAGFNREWFYRGDTGNWARVTDPAFDDESPFPIEFDDLLTTIFAFRINPRYGAETSQNLMETMSEMRKRFRARYRQEMEMPVDDALLFLPSTPRWAMPDFDFNKG